jgi:hypothetical protein
LLARLALSAGAFAAFSAQPVLAQDESISVNQPGVYGGVDIGQLRPRVAWVRTTPVPSQWCLCNTNRCVNGARSTGPPGQPLRPRLGPDWRRWRRCAQLKRQPAQQSKPAEHTTCYYIDSNIGKQYLGEQLKTL